MINSNIYSIKTKHLNNMDKEKNQLPSFTYHIDVATGNMIYDDPQVQTVYLQLERLSAFINWSQVKSELEYQNITLNISVAANAPINTTADYLINLLKWGFEKLADVEFPYFGTYGGKVVSYLLTGLVDEWTKKEKRPDALRDTYNEVWEGVKSAFDTAIYCVDTWHDDIEKYWQVQYTYNGNTVTIADLAGIDTLPTVGNVNYELAANFVAAKTKYQMTMKMIPSKWKLVLKDTDDVWDKFYTRWNNDNAWNGPYWQNDKETPNGTTGHQYYFGYWMGPLEHYDFFYNGGLPVFPDRPRKNYTIFRGPVNPVTQFGDKYNAENTTHNWFSDDIKWIGWQFDRWELQDGDGGNAPDSLTDFLFRDDHTGKEVNTEGLTTRKDVFENWSITGDKLD
jgi:hypothetical protein